MFGPGGALGFLGVPAEGAAQSQIASIVSERKSELWRVSHQQLNALVSTPLPVTIKWPKQSTETRSCHPATRARKYDPATWREERTGNMWKIAPPARNRSIQKRTQITFPTLLPVRLLHGPGHPPAAVLNARPSHAARPPALPLRALDPPPGVLFRGSHYSDH